MSAACCAPLKYSSRCIIAPIIGGKGDSRLSEHNAIARVAQRFAELSRNVEVGIGDDTAVLRPDPAAPRRELLTTDILIEGTHFDLRYMSLADVGYKALMVNLSDINAMGGRGLHALGQLGIPPGATSGDVDVLLEGVAAAAEHARSAGWNVSLVGGDTVAAPQWIVGFTVTGESSGPPLLRSGAQAGDELWHSGTLGLSTAGLWELWSQSSEERAEPRLRPKTGGINASPTTAAHLRPQPPLALGPWLQQHSLANAAQDLSDSLSQVVLQLATASGVALELDFRDYPFDPDWLEFAHQLKQTDGAYLLPATMNPAGTELRFSSLAELLLNCAEDYQLLFTVPVGAHLKLANAPAHLTPLGRVVAAEQGSSYIDERGVRNALLASGYEHL